MHEDTALISAESLIRQQSWFSPAFPVGAYSYSHGVEWAVEAGLIHDRRSLADWLGADLQFGSGRNEAIIFGEAHRNAERKAPERLLEAIGLAAALRGTSELALESTQQASACLQLLRHVWPDAALDWLSRELQGRSIAPSIAIVLGMRSASQGIPLRLALPAFLQSYSANLVTAGVRLIPLGQTDGQKTVEELEAIVLMTSRDLHDATLDDVGSAAFMVDLASMSHEQQYTRLFRS